MSADDLKLYAILSEFVLDIARFQTAAAQMFIGEITQLKSIIDLRRQIEQLPDGGEKTSARARLDHIEYEFDSRITFEKLKPLLEEQGANQARIAAVLAILKKGPGGEPPPAGPDDEPPAAS